MNRDTPIQYSLAQKAQFLNLPSCQVDSDGRNHKFTCEVDMHSDTLLQAARILLNARKVLLSGKNTSTTSE